MDRSTPVLLPTPDRDAMVKMHAARMAMKHHRRLIAQREQYELECAEYRRQGYRPHHCIHGTNQWTDYDNICGPCEDSFSDLELALMYGKADAVDMSKRLDVYRDARAAGFPVDVCERMFDFVLELLPPAANERRNRLSKAGV